MVCWLELICDWEWYYNSTCFIDHIFLKGYHPSINQHLITVIIINGIQWSQEKQTTFCLIWMSWMDGMVLLLAASFIKKWNFFNYGVNSYRFSIQLQSIPSSSAPFSLYELKDKWIELDWKISEIKEGRKRRLMGLIGRPTHNFSFRNLNSLNSMEEAINFTNQPSFLHSIKKQRKLSFLISFIHSLLIEWRN